MGSLWRPRHRRPRGIFRRTWATTTRTVTGGSAARGAVPSTTARRATARGMRRRRRRRMPQQTTPRLSSSSSSSRSSSKSRSGQMRLGVACMTAQPLSPRVPLPLPSPLPHLPCTTTTRTTTSTPLHRAEEEEREGEGLLPLQPGSALLLRPGGAGPTAGWARLLPRPQCQLCRSRLEAPAGVPSTSGQAQAWSRRHRCWRPCASLRPRPLGLPTPRRSGCACETASTRPPHATRHPLSSIFTRLAGLPRWPHHICDAPF